MYGVGMTNTATTPIMRAEKRFATLARTLGPTHPDTLAAEAECERLAARMRAAIGR